MMAEGRGRWALSHAETYLWINSLRIPIRNLLKVFDPKMLFYLVYLGLPN